MIEDMYDVLRRINEIKARFGLVRRHNPRPQGNTNPVSGEIQNQNMQSDNTLSHGTQGNRVTSTGLANPAERIQYISSFVQGGNSNTRTPQVQGQQGNLTRILNERLGGSQGFLDTFRGVIQGDETTEGE